MAAVDVSASMQLKDVFRQVEGLQRERIPRAARKAMNAVGQEMVYGIRRAVPRAQTRGHSKRSTQRAVGKRVRRQRDGFYSLKVGIGVGKKHRLTSKHVAANVAGTDERYTGAKKIRRGGKSTGLEQTGNSRKYRGRVRGSDVVRIGIEQSQATAQQKGLEVAKRELERDASSWEQRNGIK